MERGEKCGGKENNVYIVEGRVKKKKNVEIGGHACNERQCPAYRTTYLIRRGRDVMR